MRVFLDTVGCRLNQSEVERYALQLQQAGHTLVMSAENAEVAIINTCAVTSAAAQDSRQKLRQALRRNPEVHLVATGCLASLSPSLAEVIPEIETVVPNGQKDTLIADLFEKISDPGVHAVPLTINGRRRTRRFLKVQDGCNQYCTFCITRIARGKSRSVPIAQVVQEVEQAVQSGVKELVLTGVQLGSWGRDQTPPLSLAELIGEILKHLPADVRIRISSIEPWDVDDRLIALWEDPRLCPHFHLPLQSGSDRILKMMARSIDTTGYADLIEKIRARIPEVAITTDLIAGFPGENEKDFAQALQFIRQMAFSGGHPFSYSAREGTPAALLPGQIPAQVRQERVRQIRSVLDADGESFRMQRLGRETKVLWESATRQDDRWLLSGWSAEYIRVEAMSPEKRWNQVDRVKIEALTNTGWRAEIIS